MSVGAITGINTMMEIMRERVFLSHTAKEQGNVAIEYTVRSNEEGLTNLFFAFDRSLPNLQIQDNRGQDLSFMPTKYVMLLLEDFVSKCNDSEKEMLEKTINDINQGNLYIIWIKIPKKQAFEKNEIRTIVMYYSSRTENDSNNSSLYIIVKNKPHLLYYTLYKPKDHSFHFQKYATLTPKGIEMSDTEPDFIKPTLTFNSKQLRISSELQNDFILFYSFGPTLQASAASIFGAMVLISIGLIIHVGLILDKFDLNPFGLHNIFTKNAEIGIFIIASSLILPRLTNNDEIRKKYALWYVITAIIGFGMLLW